MSLSKKTISDFINGDNLATGLVIEEYKNLLYFVISTYVSNQADSDDILSETYLKILENRAKIKDQKNLKAYFCSIAKNNAISFLRKNNNQDSYIIDEMYGENDNYNILLNELMPKLTNKEGIVVTYRIVFSYSWEEINEMTGIPLSSLKLIYKNALNKLKEIAK